MDPKIRECRLNPNPRDRSETLRHTKKSHEKLSKGSGKFVRALRMKRRRVLFGIARGNFERNLLTYYLLTDMIKLSMSERTSENRASPGTSLDTIETVPCAVVIL